MVDAFSIAAPSPAPPPPTSAASAYRAKKANALLKKGYIAGIVAVYQNWDKIEKAIGLNRQQVVTANQWDSDWTNYGLAQSEAGRARVGLDIMSGGSLTVEYRSQLAAHRPSPQCQRPPARAGR